MLFPSFDCCWCKHLLTMIHNPDKNGDIGKFRCRAYPKGIPEKARKRHSGKIPNYSCANGFGFEKGEHYGMNRLSDLIDILAEAKRSLATNKRHFAEHWSEFEKEHPEWIKNYPNLIKKIEDEIAQAKENLAKVRKEYGID